MSYQIIKVFYLDIQTPTHIHRKYLTTASEAQRWIKALNSIHGMMNGCIVVGRGHEIMVDLLED